MSHAEMPVGLYWYAGNLARFQAAEEDAPPL